MAYDELTAKLVSENATLRAEVETVGAMHREACELAGHRMQELATLRAEVEKFKSTMKRMAEGWSNAIELGLIPEQHVMSASILRDEAITALTTEQKDKSDG